MRTEMELARISTWIRESTETCKTRKFKKGGKRETRKGAEDTSRRAGTRIGNGKARMRKLDKFPLTYCETFKGRATGDQV